MHGHDHIHLGRYLSNSYLPNVKGIHKFLFQAGNFAPDRWLPTYFKGFLHERKLNGHKYENCNVRVKKLIRKLGNKKKWGALSFFRLGILCHFMADSFTYPHNGEFDGGFFDHMEYERDLHQELWTCDINQLVVIRFADRIQSDFYHFYETKHNEYLSKIPSVSNDSKFIFTMTQLLMEYMLNKDIRIKYNRRYRKSQKLAA